MKGFKKWREEAEDRLKACTNTLAARVGMYNKTEVEDTMQDQRRIIKCCDEIFKLEQSLGDLMESDQFHRAEVERLKALDEVLDILDMKFHDAKDKAASDEVGVGQRNEDFKTGAEWALTYIFTQYLLLKTETKDD